MAAPGARRAARATLTRARRPKSLGKLSGGMAGSVAGIVGSSLAAQELPREPHATAFLTLTLTLSLSFLRGSALRGTNGESVAASARARKNSSASRGIEPPDMSLSHDLVLNGVGAADDALPTDAVHAGCRAGRALPPRRRARRPPLVRRLRRTGGAARRVRACAGVCAAASVAAADVAAAGDGATERRARARAEADASPPVCAELAAVVTGRAARRPDDEDATGERCGGAGDAAARKSARSAAPTGGGAAAVGGGAAAAFAASSCRVAGARSSRSIIFVMQLLLLRLQLRLHLGARLELPLELDNLLLRSFVALTAASSVTHIGGLSRVMTCVSVSPLQQLLRRLLRRRAQPRVLTRLRLSSIFEACFVSASDDASRRSSSSAAFFWSAASSGPPRVSRRSVSSRLLLLLAEERDRVDEAAVDTLVARLECLELGARSRELLLRHRVRELLAQPLHLAKPPLATALRSRSARMPPSAAAAPSARGATAPPTRRRSLRCARSGTRHWRGPQRRPS